MSLLHRRLLFPAILVLLSIAALPAAAVTVAGLQVDYDDMDPSFQEQLEEELVDVFARSGLYRWLSPEEGIQQLDGDLEECDDERCLRRIGTALDARVGLRILFDVESHIYEWTIDFYDLQTGEALISEMGTCELCGRAEVAAQFRASVAVHLGLLKVAEEDPSGPIEPDVHVVEGQTEVRIMVIPEDTRIFINDEPAGEGMATARFEPGTHEIRFSHDSHFGLRERLAITEDSAPLFVLRVHLRQGGEEHKMVVTRDGGIIDRRETVRKPLGWTSLIAGAGLTATGFLLARRHGQSTCGPDVPARQCPDVYNTAALASISTIGGAAAVTTGLMLLFWPALAGEQDDPIEAGIHLTPEVGQTFSGIGLRGRF